MDDLRLHAYYYSFAPTGQREVDLILHAVARAGKAFHHTSQWADDEMEGFYEHCEGDTCEQWIQNAANKAAAALAAKDAELAKAREDVTQAAGALLVELPEPGTPMARVMLANAMMRRERDDANARAERAEAEAAGLRADAERYRVARAKVCIVGDAFHVINLRPTYVAPDAAIEFDAAIDAARGGDK